MRYCCGLVPSSGEFGTAPPVVYRDLRNEEILRLVPEIGEESTRN